MKTIEEEFPPESHWITDHQLTAAYTRLRSRAVEMEKSLQWRPIDEAPRDGTLLLCFGCVDSENPYQHLALWAEHIGDWLTQDCSFSEPTHFRPLPPAP